MKPVADLTVFAPFNGICIGVLGILDAQPELSDLKGRWRCLGGVDVDAGANRNGQNLVGVPFTTLDLMSRDQYIAFHGKEPPQDWREATTADILKAANYETPDFCFTSPPCKGYSGLLAQSVSITPKYQALNELALRGIWLCLEAFKHDLPAFIGLENVPRMATRGRRWLDQIKGLLWGYGYAVSEQNYDCGEIGELAQSRNRFLLMARNTKKVPDFLYQPRRRPLKAIGDVLGYLPVPGTVDMPLHRLPNLQWKTWVRLAFVEAGSDWRSLNRLKVEDGQLTEYGLMPLHSSAAGLGVDDVRFNSNGNEYSQYGVLNWGGPSGAIINVKSPGQGAFSVSDPRVGQNRPLFNHAYKVARFDSYAPAVAGPGGAGGLSLADPRFTWAESAHENKFRVGKWDQHAGAIICTDKGPGSGAASVADPRPAWEGRHGNNLTVQEWEKSSRTIIAGGKGVQGGWQLVADPRPGLHRGQGSNYLTAGHYGVVPWSSSSLAITGSGQHDNGHNSVADPRLPAPNDKLNCLIVAEDNTWHRPFTTLETAALQSIFDPEQFASFKLIGNSDGQFREWIGNAIPRKAARAIGEQIGEALLMAKTGQTVILAETDVWVKPQIDRRMMIAAIQCGTVAGV